MQRFEDEGLNLGLDLVLALLGRPTGTVGIHRVQSLLDFGISAGELANQILPALYQSRGHRARGISIQRCVKVVE